MSHSTRTGALVGGLAMFFAIDVAYLLSVAGLPFAPASLGQAVIAVLPGWITIPLIELLQFWAQRLLVLGILVVFMAAGALAGALARDAGRASVAPVALGAAPWALAVLLAAIFAGEAVDLPTTLVNAGAGAATFFAALAFLLGAGPSAAPASATRRRALLGAVAVAGLVALGGLALAGGGRALRGPAELVRMAARRLRLAATIPPEEPEFAGVEGLAARITPIGEHYVVDTALVDPRVDQAAWRLEIAGAVEAPYDLTYDELLDLEAVEQVHTLECISNETGGGLVGNAVWTGVPFPDLLERARPKADAYDVVLRSMDGYSDSIRLAKALEPRTLVAYLMNGYVLPEEHGFPARALVPDIYGMKNVKWLRRIELVTYDYQGFWMEQGWSDVAIVNTHSRIDVPRRDVRWSGGEIVVAGIANAGARGIAKVEVSADAGETWTEARLERAVSDLAWRRWVLRWTPPGEGSHALLVRATDGGGLLQTRTVRDVFPDGATGWDEVTVAVRRG